MERNNVIYNAWYKTLQALNQIAKLKPLNENWKTSAWNDNKANLLNEKCLFFAIGTLVLRC